MFTLYHHTIPFMNKRRRVHASAAPAPAPTPLPETSVGEYCIKATVEAIDGTGTVDRTFIGYSPSMDITVKTAFACERFKSQGTTCGDVTLTFNTGQCKEVVLMRKRNGTVINLTNNSI